jgi:hypothetical protein
VNFTMSTSNPGGTPIIGTPATGTLTAASFSVPGVTVGPGCAADVDTAVNSALGLPTTNTTITLTVSLAPPVTPIAGRPELTG